MDRKDQADFVEPFAVIGLVLSFFFFCSYLAYCWIQSKNNDLEDTAVEVVATSKIDQMIDRIEVRLGGAFAACEYFINLFIVIKDCFKNLFFVIWPSRLTL